MFSSQSIWQYLTNQVGTELHYTWLKFGTHCNARISRNIRSTSQPDFILVHHPSLVSRQRVGLAFHFHPLNYQSGGKNKSVSRADKHWCFEQGLSAEIPHSYHHSTAPTSFSTSLLSRPFFNLSQPWWGRGLSVKRTNGSITSSTPCRVDIYATPPGDHSGYVLVNSS